VLLLVVQQFVTLLEQLVTVGQVAVVAGSHTQFHHGGWSHEEGIAPPPFDHLIPPGRVGFLHENGQCINERLDHLLLLLDFVEIDIGLADGDVVGMVPASSGFPFVLRTHLHHSLVDSFRFSRFPGSGYSGIKGAIGPIGQGMFGIL